MKDTPKKNWFIWDVSSFGVPCSNIPIRHKWINCLFPTLSIYATCVYIYIYIHNMHLDIQKKLIHTKTSQNIYQHPMCDRLLLIKIDLYPFHHYSNKKNASAVSAKKAQSRKARSAPEFEQQKTVLIISRTGFCHQQFRGFQWDLLSET